ncbi:hypothetical protein J6590_044751 [Homalodisca vitripennis]|nr:hypothetical protein J6590_044751 [Homalodisca vitripennis]
MTNCNGEERMLTRGHYKLYSCVCQLAYSNQHGRCVGGGRRNRKCDKKFCEGVSLVFCLVTSCDETGKLSHMTSYPFVVWEDRPFQPESPSGIQLRLL